MDRKGTVLQEFKNSAADYRGLALLPGGRSAVAHIHDDAIGGGGLWKIDLEHGAARTKLTDGSSHDEFPVPSPDGARVAFSSAQNRTSPRRVLIRSLDGAGDASQIARDVSVQPTSWSKSFLVFAAFEPRGQTDLWYAPISTLGEASKPVAYLQSQFSDHNGRVSPDERLMAYQSGEGGGVAAVWLRSFPDKDLLPKKRISGPERAGLPSWSRDNRELFYFVGEPGRGYPKLMAVTVTVEGSEIKTGTPEELFSLPRTDARTIATGDGQRFLVAQRGSSLVQPLTVLVNWTEVLRPSR